jgi:polyferredoxin
MSRFQEFFRLSNIRRIVQLLLFLLFLILLIQTVYPLKSWLPADFFLRLDPLTAIGTILSSRSVETLLTKFLSAIVIVVLTIFLGRFFCNWICPLGTTIDFADRVIRGKSIRVRKPKLAHTPQLRNLKYYILGGFLVAALLSLQVAWLMDPIPIATRSYAIMVYSYFSYVANALLGPLWQMPIVNKVSEPIYGFLRDNVFLPNSELGYQSITMLHHIAFIAFMGILALSLLYPRFWCRDLCPLGALFGLLSKVSFLRWVVDKEKCVECNKCYHECKTNAILEKGDGYLVQECVDCFNCQDVCPTDAIKFAFQSPFTSLQPTPKPSTHPSPSIGGEGGEGGKREKQYTPGLDLSKRRFIQAAALGAVAVPLLKLKPSDRAYPPFLIRPPGSLPEDRFLDKCIRCAECMKVCPTNALHPTLFEAGVEGIGTPKLVPKMGYCDYECNACGQVCPTGAIKKLTLAEKKKLKIGTAYFNKNKCYPWNENLNCLVCEEHCPTPEKSIKFWEVEVLEQKTNKTVMVKRPYVVTETCIGCGICENKCPIKEEPGVRVTARGEARHRERYSGGRGVDE